MSYEGLSNQVSVAFEESAGTPVTPDFSFAISESDGVQAEQEAVGVTGINTNPAINKDFISGAREYNGAFEMPAYPQALGYILKSAMGSVSSALEGSEATVYSHTFTDAITKPTMTLEQKVGSVVKRFAGFAVSNFSLNMQVGEPITLSFGGKAMSEATSSAITASYETSKVFDWSDVVSISVGGTDIKSAVENLNFEYSNNLGNFHGLSSDYDPSYLYTEGSELTGTISGTLDSNMADLRDIFTAKTVQEIIITLTADETIGDASNNKLVITISKAYLNSFTTPLGMGYNAVESEFVAGEDSSNGLIKAVLTNLVTAY